MSDLFSLLLFYVVIVFFFKLKHDLLVKYNDYRQEYTTVSRAFVPENVTGHCQKAIT